MGDTSFSFAGGRFGGNRQKLMKKILSLAMVLGVIGVVMGGCSKAEDSSASTPAAGAPAAETK